MPDDRVDPFALAESGRWRSFPALALAVACMGLVAAYAMQTSLGRWQTDEYQYFGTQRAHGWWTYFERLLPSPRPFSELLIHWYGAVVLATNQPLVGAALLVVWGASLAAMAAAAMRTVRGGASRILVAVTLGISPMLLVLQISPVTEMFYWPVATFAYLPMTASITCLLFVMNGVPRRGPCFAALLLAAFSHEIGAAFAIGFGLVAAMLAWRRGRAEPWWAVPAGAGLLVMLGLVLFRSGFVDLGADSKPYTGRLFASVGAAVQQMLADVVTAGASGQASAAWGLPVVQKALFATGFGLLWSAWGGARTNRWSLAFAGGLATAIFFSLFAAFYHYGDLCCERQETARQWLIVLGYVLGAVALLEQWGAAGRVGSWLGPLLIAGSLLPVIGQASQMRMDFEMIGVARQGRFKTWRSGLAAGPAMEFFMSPDGAGMLIHGMSLPVGRYEAEDRSSGPAEFTAAIGRFFGKSIIFTCQPWQTGDSFMMNGTFIPACPPHPGPPDYIVNGAKVDLGPGSRAEIEYRRLHPVPRGQD